MTLQLSGYSRGWGLSSNRPRGAKAKVPNCFRTAPRVLKPLHASSPTTWSPQDVAVSGSSLERSPPGCRHPPRAASPAAPRKSQRCPTPAPTNSRSQDPHSNGAAGNWPLDFLTPGWRLRSPVGGTQRPRLPPSCFRSGANCTEFKPSLRCVQ
ncbi:small integral membrane protein 15 isoform X1 [Pongo abelii]|uniref:small integral membrane protein 15 isoform X1 n=1 Tax=Pongo abelii TaxID=9601 RepID=UPI00300759CF